MNDTEHLELLATVAEVNLIEFEHPLVVDCDVEPAELAFVGSHRAVPAADDQRSGVDGERLESVYVHTEDLCEYPAILFKRLDVVAVFSLEWLSRCLRFACEWRKVTQSQDSLSKYRNWSWVSEVDLRFDRPNRCPTAPLLRLR